MTSQFKFKKLFLATTVLLTFFSPLDLQKSQISLQKTKIVISEKAALAKKSGSRKRGGSFKKKSTPSRSRQNNPQFSGDRNSNDYNRNYTPSTRNSTTGIGRGAWLIIGVFFFILLLFFLSPLLALISGTFMVGGLVVNSQKNKTQRERDNDRVTITKLEVACLTDKSDLQINLSELTANADTDSETGLFQFLQEAALILLRNDRDWSYVLSSSESIDIDAAESNFEKISIAARSKFSSEVTKDFNSEVDFIDESYGYIVVTLILGTADDRPLFETINTAEELKAALEQIAAMPEDYLMKFELLWTPEQTREKLTDDEFLMEYTEMIKIV